MIFSRVGAYLQAKKAGENRPEMLLPFVCRWRKWRFFVNEESGMECIAGDILFALCLGYAAFSFFSGTVFDDFFDGFVRGIISIFAGLFLKIGQNVSIVRGQCESFGKSRVFFWGLLLLPDIFDLILGLSKDPYVSPEKIREARERSSSKPYIGDLSEADEQSRERARRREIREFDGKKSLDSMMALFDEKPAEENPEPAYAGGSISEKSRELK